MRTLLAVPTKGRIDTIGRDTLSWLPKMGKDWVLAIEPQELPLYKRFYSSFTNNLLILDKNDQGLNYSLNAIRLYALSKMYDAVFKIDDDVRGWYGKDRKANHTFSAFGLGLAQCEAKLSQEPDVGAISFPYSNQMFEVEEEWHWRGRLQTCYLIRPESWYVNLNMKDNDDFAAFISLRFAGKEVPRYNWMGQVVKPVAKNPGGLQLFNRAETMKKSNAILKMEFPDLRFRKVDGKPWDEEPDMRSVP